MAVWLCPGQGAQAPRMGADFVLDGRFALLADTFAVACRVTGVDVAALALSGTQAEIDDPFNAQVITAALTIGVGRELLERGYKPDAMVGFSLGQISALALSGMLSVEDTFALLKERAAGMAQACQERRGAMCALLKASHDEARELCDECALGQVLVPANYNAAGQVVVSGDADAVSRAQEAWGIKPGKRAARLNVAGAFHSPLMEAAAARTQAAAAGMHFGAPCCALLCNTDAKPFEAADAARRLGLQVKSPVMFEQSINALLQKGADEFVEIGFGGVLCGLVKRQDRSSRRVSLGTVADFDEYVGAAGSQGSADKEAGDE